MRVQRRSAWAAAVAVLTVDVAANSWDSFIDPAQPPRFPGFVGPVIDTLYRAGNWPTLTCKSGGATCAPADATYLHGGIPQLAVRNMTAHLAKLTVDIEEQIPDEGWRGLANFE